MEPESAISAVSAPSRVLAARPSSRRERSPLRLQHKILRIKINSNIFSAIKIPR
jgi:hypothetical protein